MSDIGAVLAAIWQILSIEFEIWGLTFSFLQLALFSTVAGAVVWLIFYWLKG